jgi:molecular chaperone HtpG
MSAVPQRDAFAVDLSGLLEVLGGHLYSSPSVFVRELLQNAVDACTQRKRGKGRVEVRLDSQSGTIVFEDDGVGMDEATVRNSLARIGASTKRAGENREALLGRFGIGLLAGFLVTDELVVETLQDGGVPLRWVGRRSGVYELTTSTRKEVGSSVTVRLRAGCEEFGSPERLAQLVTKYGCSLPVEVSLNIDGVEQHISSARPWLEGAEAGKAWLEARGVKPLGVEPVKLGKTRGLLWFGTGAEFELPGVDVFVKGMPVAERMVGLLPKWAGFCGAVLDSTALMPTASREDLVRDEAFDKVAAGIEAQVLAWLQREGEAGSPAFHALLEQSPAALKSACIAYPTLRSVVGHLLRFETTAGALRWSEMRAHVKAGVLLAASSTRDFENARALTASRGVLVVNQGYAYEAELLSALAAAEQVIIEPLTPAHLAKLIAPGKAEARRYEGLLALTRAAFDSDAIDVRVGHFAPAELPALLLSTEDDLRSRAMEVASRATGFASGFLSFFSATKATRVTLVLNLDNELVRALPRVLEGDALVRVVRLLYVYAAMTLRRHLSVAEAKTFANDLVALLGSKAVAGIVNA